MSEREFEVEAAAIELHVGNVVESLTDWARHMAARFNATVYLLGSTLYNPKPRDVDVRIVVADHEFGARYGMTMKPCDEPPTEERVGRTAKIMFDEEGVTQRWVDDIAKLSGAVCIRLKENADVKVWPESYFRHGYPSPVVLAAPSARRFIYNRYTPDPRVKDRDA